MDTLNGHNLKPVGAGKIVAKFEEGQKAVSLTSKHPNVFLKVTSVVTFQSLF